MGTVMSTIALAVVVVVAVLVVWCVAGFFIAGVVGRTFARGQKVVEAAEPVNPLATRTGLTTLVVPEPRTRSNRTTAAGL